MTPMRPVLSLDFVRLSRLPLAVLLLAASSLSFGQAAPAVSTIFAFNGSVPVGGLLLGADGALYGVSSANTVVSGGLVYRSTLDGLSVRTLHQFTGADGSAPRAPLVEASDGLLYGSTRLGSSTDAFSSGMTYQIASDGSGFTVLHQFESWTDRNVNGSPINTDGAYPEAALIEGSDGFLYGVTRAGGTNGTGVVFRQSRVGPDFPVSVLHDFGQVTSTASDAFITNADGAAPSGSLLEAYGYLYGTTTVGGTHGRGTIFRLQLDGSGFDVVHEFTSVATTSPFNNVDGATPVVGLTDGQDGMLYGVASLGGANGIGTLFMLDPNFVLDPDGHRIWTLTPLHDFELANGSTPSGALIVGTVDNVTRLYGTTFYGGTDANDATTNLGTIFSIARDGTGFTKLLSFDGNQGSNPSGPLLQLDASTFVGIAVADGKCNQGTVFRFSLTGETIKGNTSCGQKKKNKSGGGATEPLVVLLFSVLGLARRRRDS
jgi:uncharacterized repeat protein (TIGR03803 family)